MSELLIAIALLCQLHTGNGTVYQTAKEQASCQTYYGRCMQDKWLNANTFPSPSAQAALLICMEKRGVNP